MNIEQANAIAMAEILRKIGSRPVKQRGNDIWYLSPFRNEKTASFKVNIAACWYNGIFSTIKFQLITMNLPPFHSLVLINNSYRLNMIYSYIIHNLFNCQ